MSAVFTDIVTVSDVRATADARHGLQLYGLLKLRRATDRRIAELDRRVEHQLAAPGALSDEAGDAIDVLCAAVKEVTEFARRPRAGDPPCVRRPAPRKAHALALTQGVRPQRGAARPPRASRVSEGAHAGH